MKWMVPLGVCFHVGLEWLERSSHRLMQQKPGDQRAVGLAYKIHRFLFKCLMGGAAKMPSSSCQCLCLFVFLTENARFLFATMCEDSDFNRNKKSLNRSVCNVLYVSSIYHLHSNCVILASSSSHLQASAFGRLINFQ